MEQGDVARWRHQMGQGITPWANQPGRVGEVGTSSWLMLTGAPSPDVNMALVYDNGPHVLSSVLTNIEHLGCPALVSLAGDGKTRAHDLTGAWKGVGEMPMMTAELTQAPHAPDPRVRRAGPGDEEAVRALLAEAYGLSPEIAGVCTEILQRPVDTMTIWLLEDDGQAVGLDRDGLPSSRRRLDLVHGHTGRIRAARLRAFFAGRGPGRRAEEWRQYRSARSNARRAAALCGNGLAARRGLADLYQRRLGTVLALTALHPSSRPGSALLAKQQYDRKLRIYDAVMTASAPLAGAHLQDTGSAR